MVQTDTKPTETISPVHIHWMERGQTILLTQIGGCLTFDFMTGMRADLKYAVVPAILPTTFRGGNLVGSLGKQIT